MPRVVIHNQVIAYEVGQEYIQAWYDAEQGKLDLFVLIIEGSIATRRSTATATGRGSASTRRRQPITTNEWVDRLANKAAAVVAIGTCATYGGIPAMKNNPTGAMGLPDYLGWNWKSKAGLPVVCIPGCPAQPDNMTEVLLYLVLHLGGLAPAPELDDQLRPKWLFERTAHESCNRAAFYERATSPPIRLRPPLPRQARLPGPGGQVQRAAARLGERHRRLPERGRHLHGLHDAGLPGQVHAVHAGGPEGPHLGQRGAVHLRAGAALPPRRSPSSAPTTTSPSGASAASSSRPATRSGGSRRAPPSRRREHEHGAG